jgi:HAD superfamily hydrolase (TIGR01509 family)
MTDCVIVDLDGPILDGKYRHHECYRQILIEHGYTALPLGRYWNLKRTGASTEQQLAASGAQRAYTEFLIAWRKQIEDPTMLALDRLQPGVVNRLGEWHADGIQLVLATMRRHPDRAQGQLRSFGLSGFFSAAVVCKDNGGPSAKAQQVLKAMGTRPDRCLWIGDSEADIEAARILGCQTWGVTCGVRSRSYLAALSPNYLSKDLLGVDPSRARYP